MTDLFKLAWEAHTSERQFYSPSFTPDQYIVTGKASAQYGGKRNGAWWLDNGPVMVEKYRTWRQETGWDLWETEPGVAPAIELELNFRLPGDIPIKAFIDRVFVLPTGELAVVDIKTGSRMPEWPEQLGLYATGLEIQYGIRPTYGYYWDAHKGTHGLPLTLDMYTADYLAALYQDAIRGINSNSFIPKPANACHNWCGQARNCAAVNGEDAHKNDPLLIAGTNLTVAVAEENQQ